MPTCNQAQPCCCTEFALTDVMVGKPHSDMGSFPHPLVTSTSRAAFHWGDTNQVSSGHHPSPSTDPPDPSGMAPLGGWQGNHPKCLVLRTSFLYQYHTCTITQQIPDLSPTGNLEQQRGKQGTSTGRCCACQTTLRKSLFS